MAMRAEGLYYFSFSLKEKKVQPESLRKEIVVERASYSFDSLIFKVKT